ncbi:glycoside hydrolase family 97 catalytic domain-containing protein [Mucilaginibacter sp. PAMB04274]|uniref:glycoside hydrolase family 97 protein n=1 Tax=Mucilaginibacter sp. PAMB04274 TaxID=3138568 RepID=UPI0031F62078
MRIFNLLLSLTFLFFTQVYGQVLTVQSPDKQLQLSVLVRNGKPTFKVTYKGNVMLEDSPLGLKTNEGDFTTDIRYVSKSEGIVQKDYTQSRIKKSEIKYQANQLTCTFENAQQRKFAVQFQVSNNNIAFRYEFPEWGERRSCVIETEATGFNFPLATTTFLSGMMSPMTGFARTAPSYESAYQADVPIVKTNRRNEGYIFPGLFHINNKGWVLLSETGVSSLYCASHLSEASADGVYTVEYPNAKQNNGFGSSGAAIALPGVTPWRTITVSDNLKPIVETTIPFDVVEPLYEPSQPYKYGRATWSWIMWQDNSMNYADQVRFIDLAASMNFEYILIDALWDKNIGKTRMQELVAYAKSKGVGVFLWYNSNGTFNDAPQGPRNKMNTAIERKKEMRWLKEIGIKGLKVDFFGGDKQETMRLYEDILSDANDYGLMIIFHGTTLPRGWERMYPNFVGAEAVLASEMLVFSEGVRAAEAYNATLHPFIRNTVGSMEFGGVILNKYLVKSNEGRNKRLTTDAFQLATAILYQNPVQMFALTPNNLTDVPSFELDFLKKVPTTWDETLFIDGYPGKYCVIARRSGKQWYVAGANATKEGLKLKVKLPMLAGKTVSLYEDGANGLVKSQKVDVKHSAQLELQMQPNGGLVITTN